MTHQIAIAKLIVLQKNKLFFNNNTFSLHTQQHFADVLKGMHILKLLKEGVLKKNLLIMLDLNNRTWSVGFGWKHT